MRMWTEPYSLEAGRSLLYGRTRVHEDDLFFKQREAIGYIRIFIICGEDHEILMRSYYTLV